MHCYAKEVDRRVIKAVGGREKNWSGERANFVCRVWVTYGIKSDMVFIPATLSQRHCCCLVVG